MERRRTKRRARRVQVRITDSNGGSSHLGFTTNISHTGMFVSLNHILQPGSRVRIEIVDRDASVIVEAVVARALQVPALFRGLEHQGMGLRFLQVSELIGEFLPESVALAEGPVSTSPADGPPAAESARASAEPSSGASAAGRFAAVNWPLETGGAKPPPFAAVTGSAAATGNAAATSDAQTHGDVADSINAVFTHNAPNTRAASNTGHTAPPGHTAPSGFTAGAAARGGPAPADAGLVTRSTGSGEAPPAFGLARAAQGSPAPAVEERLAVEPFAVHPLAEREPVLQFGAAGVQTAPLGFRIAASAPPPPRSAAPPLRVPSAAGPSPDAPSPTDWGPVAAPSRLPPAQSSDGDSGRASTPTPAYGIPAAAPAPRAPGAVTDFHGPRQTNRESVLLQTPLERQTQRQPAVGPQSRGGAPSIGAALAQAARQGGGATPPPPGAATASTSGGRPLYSITCQSREELRTYLSTQIQYGGFFVRNPQPPPLQSLVVVELLLAGNPEAVRVAARVIHHATEPSKPVGFAVEFGDVSTAIAGARRLLK